MIEVMNLIGVDYATFGNHELDYGYQSLKNRLAGVDCDVEDNEMGYVDYPESTAQVRVWSSKSLNYIGNVPLIMSCSN